MADDTYTTSKVIEDQREALRNTDALTEEEADQLYEDTLTRVMMAAQNADRGWEKSEYRAATDTLLALARYGAFSQNVREANFAVIRTGLLAVTLFQSLVLLYIMVFNSPGALVLLALSISVLALLLTNHALK